MNSKKKIIIPVVAAVLLIVAAVIVFCVIKPFSKQPEIIEKRVSTGDMAYISGSSLYYIADINEGKDTAVKVKDIEIADGINYKASGIVLDDIKGYLYFFDEIEDKNAGTLCRIPTGKITADENANASNIEVIDYDIYIASVTPYTKGVLYVKKDDRLCYYDGKNEPDSIARDVFRYVVFEDQDRVTIMNMAGELWISRLSTGELVAMIDTEVNNVRNWDPSFLVYDKYLDYRASEENYKDTYDGHVMLYSASENGGVVELSPNCGEIFELDEKKKIVTYSSTNRTNVNMYDLVEDVDIENMSAPVLEDYTKASTLDDVNAALSENYSSSQKLIDELDVKMFFYGETGLYRVDAEDVTYAYDPEEDAWYIFDADKYLEDENNYYLAYFDQEALAEKREELKNKNLSITTNQICRYKNGKVEVVIDDVDEILKAGVNAFVYTKSIIDVVEEKTNIVQVGDVDAFYFDIENQMLYGENRDTNEYIGTIDGDETLVSSVIPDLDSVVNLDYNSADKSLIIGMIDESGKNNRLVSYRLTDDVYEEDEILSENGYFWGVIDGRMYYLDEIVDGAGDLNCYVGGSKKLMAKGIVYGLALLPEDGTVWGYSAKDSETGCFDLAIFDSDGSKTEVGKNLIGFEWIGDNRLICCDKGNVYYYNDGEMNVIIENVTCYEYVNSEEVPSI